MPFDTLSLERPGGRSQRNPSLVVEFEYLGVKNRRKSGGKQVFWHQEEGTEPIGGALLRIAGAGRPLDGAISMDTTSVGVEHGMGELVSCGEALNHFRQRWRDPHFSAVPVNDTRNFQIISPSHVQTHVSYIGQSIALQLESVLHVEQLDRIGRHLVAQSSRRLRHS